MPFAHRDVAGWMKPWPITFTRRPRLTWRCRFMSLRQALRFKAFWHDQRGKRVSAAVAAVRIKKHNWLQKDHQIGSAAHVGHCLHRPVIMVHRGVIVDGNHTLLALERRKYKGRIMVWEAV